MFDVFRFDVFDAFQISAFDALKQMHSIFRNDVLDVCGKELMIVFVAFTTESSVPVDDISSHCSNPVTLCTILSCVDNFFLSSLSLVIREV